MTRLLVVLLIAMITGSLFVACNQGQQEQQPPQEQIQQEPAQPVEQPELTDDATVDIDISIQQEPAQPVEQPEQPAEPAPAGEEAAPMEE